MTLRNTFLMITFHVNGCAFFFFVGFHMTAHLEMLAVKFLFGSDFADAGRPPCVLLLCLAILTFSML